MESWCLDPFLIRVPQLIGHFLRASRHLIFDRLLDFFSRLHQMILLARRGLRLVLNFLIDLLERGQILCKLRYLFEVRHCQLLLEPLLLILVETVRLPLQFLNVIHHVLGLNVVRLGRLLAE